MPNREPVASLLGGKYRILDRLGGGSLGDVYRGENTVTGRPVAVKILRPDFASEKALVSRFFQEAQAVNKIRHPNIVDVLDAGVSEGTAFLAMECLSGEASSTALSRLGRLSFQAVLAIGVEVLDALDASHRAGIVHRDLKPDNVFLHRPMADVPVVVKVLDFGAARLYEPIGGAPRLHAPIALGSTDYLSPEQAVGDAVMDGRTDIFSLAIVLFELLAGQLPFRAPTGVATAYRVVHGPPPTFAEVGLPAHPMLESIIGKALSKRPADRYPTAADFARELLRAAPDAQRRAQALQEVLGDHSSGTLPAAQHPSSPPRPASSPPFSSGPAYRSSASALRISLSSRPPDFGTAPLETGETRNSSLAPPNSESSRPSSGRERRTSVPPPMPAPAFCHVRGHVLRATDQYILGIHGATVRDRILARLPARYSDDFRHGSITGVVLYELDVFEAYASAANAIVLGNEVTRWREIGRGSVDGELASLMRTLARSTDEATLLRRCNAMWSRLTDFGAWTTDLKREGEAVVHVSDLGPAPLTLRQWLVGVVEQTLRRAGHTGTTVAMRAGDSPRTSELDLLIYLR